MPDELLEETEETFCRLCLGLTIVNQAMDLKSNKLLYDVLKGVFPGMKLDLVETPRICKSCAEKMQFAFTFKDSILCNELKLQSDKDFVAEAVNVCRLCLKHSDEKVIFLYDNNCSYSYQLVRTMIEIATTQLNFDILQKPIMCNHCWMVIKDIYTFKKTCFKAEEKLRTLFKKDGIEVIALSDKEVLHMIYREKNIEVCQSTDNTEDSEEDSDQDVKVFSEITEDLHGKSFTTTMTEFMKSTWNTEFCIKKEKESSSLESSNGTSETNVCNETNINKQPILRDCQSDLTSGNQGDTTCGIKNEDVDADSDDSDIFQEKIRDKNVVEICIREPVNRNRKDRTGVVNGVTILNNGESEKTGNLKELVEIVKHDIYEGDLSDFDSSTDSSDAGNLTETPVANDIPVVAQIGPAKHTEQSKLLRINLADCVKNPAVQKYASPKEYCRLRINLTDCVKYQSSQNITKKRQKSSEQPKRLKKFTSINLTHGINKYKFKSSLPKLKIHQNKRTKIIRCGECDFVTSEKQQIEAHMENHIRSSEERNKCKKCQFVFDDQEDMTQHLRNCQLGADSSEKKKVSRMSSKDQSVRYSQATRKGDHPKPCKTTKALTKHRVHLEETANREKQNLLHTWDKKYICNICQRGFRCTGNLRRHKRTHSDERNFACGICYRGFKSKPEVRAHLTVHSTERKCICNVCGKGFKTKCALKCHLVTHSADRNFYCDICKKGFKSKSQLRAHLFVHSAQRNYICEICQKSFKTAHHKYRHKDLVHKGERNFFCDICQKGFKTPRNLKSHYVRHRDERNFLCGVCHKAFKCKISLCNHQLIHAQKRFVCDICQKMFHTSGNLNRHKLTHGTERFFLCDVCQKGFKTKWAVKIHKSMHSDARNFICDICEKRFKTLGNLYEHKVGHRNVRNFVCNICKDTFKKRSVLKQHLTTTHSDDRKFLCETCQKAFKTSCNLHRHKQSNCDGRPLLCHICNKSFRKSSTLERHQDTACDGKGVTCYHCQKEFKTKSQLCKHFVMHSAVTPN